MTSMGGASAREDSTRAPLRIALFSGNYNYVMDGPVRALNKLVDHLELRGHEVIVFAPTARESYLEHAGTLISIPSMAAPRRPEYRIGIGLNGRARRTLEDFQPRLVHVAAPDLGGLGALRYARRANIPAVASFHTRFETYPQYYGMPWLKGALIRYMRYFYGRCEHVYPPSQSMADELSAEGVGNEMRLWARGVDHTLFHPDRRDMTWRRSLGFKDDDVVVLFVGRLVLEKGIREFAKAMAEATKKAPALRALIVGDGPERKRFQTLLPDGVFLGHQGGEALARAYASGDVFFNPSITETFGQVTLESMASGRPALCANAPGSISLVNDGESGFVTPPHIDAYARYLVRLAEDQALRARLGEAARERSLAYSWETVFNGLIDNYYDAIAQFNADRPRGQAPAAAAT